MSVVESGKARPRYCVNCAAMLSPGMRFCPGCGSPAEFGAMPPGQQTPLPLPVPTAPSSFRQIASGALAADYSAQAAASRSYVTPAIVSLVLYFFYIPGLVVNLIYLIAANDDKRKSGVNPQGRGCLVALMAVIGIGFPALIILLKFMAWGLGAIIASS